MTTEHSPPPGNKNFEPNDKEQKVQQLIRELEAVEGQTIEEQTFDHSNDAGVRLKLGTAISEVAKIESPLKVAVIVSNGSLWNIPKELDVDLVLRINMNSNQIERDKERKAEILTATTTQELTPDFSKGLSDADFAVMKKARDRNYTFEIETKSLGDYHYLASQEMLEKLQTFLQKNSIAFLGGDLTDAAYMHKIGELLKASGAEIAFADLTNVKGWVRGKENEYYAALAELPFREDTQILHSAHSGKAGRSPILSVLSTGLKGYQNHRHFKGLAPDSWL